MMEEPDSSLRYRYGYPLGVRAKRFLSEVSVIGLRYVTLSEARWQRRLFWALTVIIGIGFSIYQFIGMVQYYLSNPTMVTIEVINNNTMIFPTVTLCNVNMFNQSKFRTAGPVPQRLAQTLHNPWVITGLENEINMTEARMMLEQLPDEDWSSLYNNYSVDWDQCIISCRFGAEICNDKLQPKETDAGYCIQFNADGNYTVNYPGIESALSLILDAHQDLYSASLTSAAGFMMLLHPNEESPSVHSQGINLEPDKYTKVMITFDELEMLPAPHGNCNDGSGYNYAKCLSSCQASWVDRECGCVLPYHPRGNSTVCNPVVSIECALPSMLHFGQLNVETHCGCAHQCRDTQFIPTVTSAVTSVYFKEFMKERFPALKTETNFLQVEVLFPHFRYRRTRVVPAYSILSLFCDLGGTLGLLMGSSILTLFEFGDFFVVTMANTFFCKKRKNEEAADSPFPNKVLDPSIIN